MVSGITLWLLLARRKRVAARWLFVGYFAVSVFLQNLLFDPIDKTETAASAPEAAMTRSASGPRTQKEAKKVFRNAELGLDPATEKQEGRHAETFEQLAREYLEHHAKVKKRAGQKMNE